MLYGERFQVLLVLRRQAWRRRAVRLVHLALLRLPADGLEVLDTGFCKVDLFVSLDPDPTSSAKLLVEGPCGGSLAHQREDFVTGDYALPDHEPLAVHPDAIALPPGKPAPVPDARFCASLYRDRSGAGFKALE